MLQENIVTFINKVFATTFKVLKKNASENKTPTINSKVTVLKMLKPKTERERV